MVITAVVDRVIACTLITDLTIHRAIITHMPKTKVTEKRSYYSAFVKTALAETEITYRATQKDVVLDVFFTLDMEDLFA